MAVAGGADCQEAVALQLPASDLDPAQVDYVLSFFQRQIVRDVYGRNQETKLRCKLFAQGADLPPPRLGEFRNARGLVKGPGEEQRDQLPVKLG